jgi:deazaflavin-dependent oxidoreductase (nitroreductase family)
MTTTDPRAEYAAFTKALIEDVRANGHPTSGMFEGRPVLILTTIGAKSGEPRVAPLVYSRHGDDLVIMASKGGAPTHPAWYLNLVANPVVTVETEGEKYQARATEAHGEERDRIWDAHVELNPGFAEYVEKAGDRVIPVILLSRIDEA